MRRVLGMMLVHALLLVLLGVVAVFVLYGRENTWKLIFGDADQGYLAFETLAPGAKPNKFLVAPQGLTPAAAPPDAEAPVYIAAPAALFALVDKIAGSEALTERVARFDATFEARYVQRTSMMRFPDTIWVKVIPVGTDRAALALFSRSQIGHSDLGVNELRLRRWIEQVDTHLPRAPKP